MRRGSDAGRRESVVTVPMMTATRVCMNTRSSEKPVRHPDATSSAGRAGDDVPFVLASVPTWVTVLQLLAAGIVGGFCVLQWVWWRGERPASAAWSFAWSLDMSLVLAVGGLYALTMPGTLQDVLVYVHAQLIAALHPHRRPGDAGDRRRSTGSRPWVWAAGEPVRDPCPRVVGPRRPAPAAGSTRTP